MARIRSIKPEFFRHGRLFDAERESGLPLRIAFAGLWTSADREGRFRWEPRELKLDCLPHDDVDFSRVLDALETRGFIVKYTQNDEVFGFIPSWNIHQVVNNKEAPSKLPNPQDCLVLTRAARVPDASPTRDNLFQGERKGREGKGKDTATQPASPSVSPLDFKREVFTRGISYLTANGVKDPHARSFLAMLRKQFGDPEIMNALAAAEAECVSEPIPFMQQFLKGKPNGQRFSGKPAGPLSRIASRLTSSGGAGSAEEAVHE